MNQDSRRHFKRVAAAFVCLSGAASASADDFVVEPDDFAAGTVLNTVLSEVTLTTITGGGSGTANVLAVNTGGFASTGTLSFGHNTGFSQGLFWDEGSAELRADFARFASSVTIDVIPDDGNDPAFLRAFDCAGNLIDEATSSAGPTGQTVTLTVDSSSGNIAFVVAAGIPGDTVALDNLRFTILPHCPADIADDIGTLGAPDGQVSFGDFLAMLGLLGPCPGGTPGCTGDIADDSGGPCTDGQVSFGDFLFALTVLGPCP